LAEIHTAPNPKNQLRSKNCQPNITRSTVDLLQKIGGAGPNSMVFVEYLRRYSTKSKFRGVRVNYPPLPLVSGKTVHSILFSLCTALASACGRACPTFGELPAPPLVIPRPPGRWRPLAPPCLRRSRTSLHHTDLPPPSDADRPRRQRGRARLCSGESVPAPWDTSLRPHEGPSAPSYAAPRTPPIAARLRAARWRGCAPAQRPDLQATGRNRLFLV
jgi:hypothetical protein